MLSFNPFTGKLDLTGKSQDISGKLDLVGGTMTGQLVLQAASSTGAINISPTWNNAGTNFVGVYGRVTNTASGADSKLIDLGTVAGGSLFSVSLAGGVVAAGVKSRDSYLGYFQSAWLTLVSDAAAITMGAFNDVTLDRPTADTLYLYSAYGSGSKLRIGGDNATRAKYLQLTHDGTNAVISSSSGSVVFDTATSSGAINISPTWNNAGTNFTGIYGRVTNTASGASSCLIDLGTVASGSLFKVGKDAIMQINGDTLGTIARRSDINMLMLQAVGSGAYGVIGIGHGHNPGINISSAYHLAWTNDTPASARDITLMRVAAGVLGLTASGSTGGATLEMREQTAPSAPGANCVRFYLEDNGAGKSRVMALFSSGAAQQIAIEP